MTMVEQEKTLIAQRLRNLQIEALELAADWSAQLEYQENAKSVSVSSEVINQWNDVSQFDAAVDLPKPPYTEQEETALRKFALAVDDVCKRTPLILPNVPAIFDEPAWADLKNAAEQALEVMMTQGRIFEGTSAKDDQ